MGDDGSSRSERLYEVIAAYLEAAEGGVEPDRAEWLARHPELADELARFFANRDQVAGLAGLKSEPTVDYGRRADPGWPGAGSRVGYFGDYEILGEIARGGMGVVFRARQLSLNRPVALKMLRPELFARPIDVQRLRLEAEAAASLDHPNIVPIYEVGEHDGLHYFSMKLVEGGNLARRIAERPIDPAEGARLVATVARAVDSAHRRGILHRDLKPSNVLIDGRGEPLVGDFGLAKRLGPGDPGLTESGVVVGTPAYMAPEQAAASGESATTTSADIYSLGAILYEILTRRAPYRGASAGVILARILEGELARPRSIVPDLDRDLETICLTCLDRDPARRYPTAAALADDLDRWSRGEPIAARPRPVWSRGLRWARRHPAAAAVALLAPIAAIAIVAMLDARADRDRFRTVVTKAESGQAVEAARRSELEAIVRVTAKADVADRIAAAAEALEADDTVAARRSLDEVGLAERRWEWNYLNNQAHAERSILRGHGDRVGAVAYAPRGDRLASASDDGTVRIWDARTGAELRVLRGPTGPVYAVAFTPDGATLGAAGSDGSLTLWDVEAGTPGVVFRGHSGWVTAVAFGADGQLVATAGADGTAKLWDAATGSTIANLLGHEGAVLDLAFRPGGKQVATAGADATVRIWDADSTGEARPLRTLDGASGPLHAVAYSPDGRSLVAAGSDRIIRRWDADAGTLVANWPAAPATIFGIAFTADGRRVITVGAERAARIWDAGRGEPLGRLKGHEANVSGVAIRPDGATIATASADRTVRLWDNRDDPSYDSPPIDDADGRAIAWVGGLGWLAVGDSSGRAWIGPPGSPGEFRSWPAHRGGVTAIADGGGGRLVTGGRDGVARVWAIEGDLGRPIAEFRGHGEAISSLAVAPDGLSVASGSGTPLGIHATPEGKGPILEGDDRTVRVWEVATGRERLALRGLPGGVGAVAFAPDGRTLAAGGKGGAILRWELEEGRPLGDPLHHPGIVTALAYRPDGSMLASGGTHETVKLWSTRDGSELATLDGHAHWALSVAFTPDGSRLVSGGADRTIVAWDPDDRLPILRLVDHPGWVESLAFDGRGARLASGGGVGRVLVWDGSGRDDADGRRSSGPACP